MAKSMLFGTRSIVERVSGAISTIAVGIFLLLNTTGVVPWEAWGTILLIFFRIWPIFLIFAGIQIIFKNQLASIALNILGTVLFLLILATAAILNTTNHPLKKSLEQNLNFIVFEQGEAKTFSKSISQEEFPITEINLRELNLKYTAEDFLIDTAESNKDYVSLNATYRGDSVTPFLKATKSDSTLKIESGIERSRDFQLPFFFGSPKLDTKIGLNSVPTDVNLSMTSGNGEVNLSNLNLQNLNTQITSGEMKLNLQNTSANKVTIQLTSGELDLVFSRNANVKIEYKKTSGEIEVNSEEKRERTGSIILGDINASNVTEVSLQVTSGEVNIKTN